MVVGAAPYLDFSDNDVFNTVVSDEKYVFYEILLFIFSGIHTKQVN